MSNNKKKAKIKKLKEDIQEYFDSPNLLLKISVMNATDCRQALLKMWVIEKIAELELAIEDLQETKKDK